MIHYWGRTSPARVHPAVCYAWSKCEASAMRSIAVACTGFVCHAAEPAAEPGCQICFEDYGRRPSSWTRRQASSGSALPRTWRRRRRRRRRRWRRRPRRRLGRMWPARTLGAAGGSGASAGAGAGRHAMNARRGNAAGSGVANASSLCRAAQRPRRLGVGISGHGRVVPACLRTAAARRRR